MTLDQKWKRNLETRPGHYFALHLRNGNYSIHKYRKQKAYK